MALTKADLVRFAEAAENTSCALSYAEAAFAFLSRAHDDFPKGEHLGFAALCYLCGKGLEGVLDKDSETVERLVSHLRTFPQEVTK